MKISVNWLYRQFRGSTRMRASMSRVSSRKRAMMGSRPVNSGIRPNWNRSVGFTRSFSRSRMPWLSLAEAEM
ncbi:hypothetical protein D3C83_180420 [compost metagenome]